MLGKAFGMSWQHKILTFLLFGQGLFLLPIVYAQAPQTQEIPFLGLTADAVTSLLGEPDIKRGESGGAREGWVYGNSLVFFAEGKVSAVSDSGDLLDRRKAKKLNQEELSHDPFRNEGWTEPWQPPEPTKPEDVVIDLMKD